MNSVRKHSIEIAAVVVALVSAAGALWAVLEADQANDAADAVARQQQAFEADVEERESAPVLAPDVEPELRGKPIRVPTDRGTFTKNRAERLLVHIIQNRPADEPTPQIVVPMRNVGAGLAVVPVTLSFPTTCPVEPPKRDLPVFESGQGGRYLGPSNILPGESRQLSFSPLAGQRPEPYFRALKATGELSLLVFYTDLLGRRLRWTCVTYQRGKRTDSWSVVYPYYGDKPR